MLYWIYVHRPFPPAVLITLMSPGVVGRDPRPEGNRHRHQHQELSCLDTRPVQGQGRCGGRRGKACMAKAGHPVTSQHHACFEMPACSQMSCMSGIDMMLCMLHTEGRCCRTASTCRISYAACPVTAHSAHVPYHGVYIHPTCLCAI